LNSSDECFPPFAPFVATWLIAMTGDSLSPSFYLMFTAGLSIIALMVVRQWESRGSFYGPKQPPGRPDDRG
jgi:MFS transporter, MHS family, proline/betaine transporter